MSHNNHIIEVKIALTIKKIQVLEPTTSRGYSSSQEIQSFVKVLVIITFGSCSFPQKSQNSIRILGPKTFKTYLYFLITPPPLKIVVDFCHCRLCLDLFHL